MKVIQVIIFLTVFLHASMGCGYLLEVPYSGPSSVYTQYMFVWNFKNINTVWMKKKSSFCHMPD